MKRRKFIKTGAATTLGFGMGLTLFNGKSVADTSANNTINIALVGCGGRGSQLLHGFNYSNDTRITGFQEFEDVKTLYCCDARKDRGEKAAAQSGSLYVPDLRAILDDKNVDAVVCALPDHWHALASVLACQAGKDVFTEKPASHSAWEGGKMVEAARKYKRIVQHGTQNRSAPYNFEAKKYIEDGKLGKIHFCRVYNMKEWTNFKLAPATEPPADFDWDRWLGPAPMRPFSPSYASCWHHLWDFSSGDMINDGIHQLDLARWLIGKELPKSAYCVGGRFDSEGDAETPDTQISTFEFDDMTMTFELTLYTPYMLKTDAVVRQSDLFPYWMQNATRIEIYGSKGLMIVGRHGGGWEVYDRPKDRRPVVKESMHGRFSDVEHKRNFLDCIRSRELPNADIETGHVSTLLAHYSTISYRLGGIKLDINTEDGTIKTPGAERFWKRDYRAPYVIPAEV